MKRKESEKLVERTLYNYTKEKGGLCIKLLTAFFQGLPDRLILLPDRKAIFVELKTTGEKPRKIQTIVHNKLRALGFSVYVVDTCDKARECIDITVNTPF